jgi:hypothetical protein
MKTLRNLAFAGIAALICLAPVIGADAGRAISGQPLVLFVRDFATTNFVSSEDRSAVAFSGVLPRVAFRLLSPLWTTQTDRR